MNNIKFRVWCKNFNEWEKDEVFIDKHGYAYHIGSKSGMTPLNLHNHIIQRGTGLVDKFGKEAYEGDVVKYNIPWLDIYVNREIVYNKDFLCFVVKAANDSFILLEEVLDMKEIEIIGNIFENKDLLNEA